jgi:hypothetical protein
VIRWKQQGPALIGELHLLDGRSAYVVLVGPRNAHTGAVLVLTGNSESERETAFLMESVHLLHPQQVVEVLCIQERAFGDKGLPFPELT